MKRGSTMTVRGTSTRGTYSLDTYSLKGFTAAIEAMRGACVKLSPHDLKPLAVDGRPSLIGLDVEALEACLAELGEPERQRRLRARQLFHWLYHRGTASFDEMSTLQRDLRLRLAESYSVARPAIVTEQRSDDGTRKWLLRFADGQEVETVFIPEDDRGALCVSTQVGCTLTCTFCHTGTMPLVRNLGTAEIVAQMLVARDQLAEWPTGRDGRLFTNIVVMGMGEPLYNYDHTVAALRLAMDEHGLNLSRRRITVSTSGVVPRIERLGADLGVGLAISLHAVRDELRDVLVPINRKWNIATLLDGLPQLSVAAADHVRVRDAARRERQRRRRARAGPPARRDPGQGQSDPLQRLARRALRLLVEQPHPRLRRDRRGRRPRLAGAHAAWARHPGRLRPAQDREPAPAPRLSAAA